MLDRQSNLVFGDATSFLPVLEETVAAISDSTYRFVDANDFVATSGSDPRAFAKFYWTQRLMHCHLAAGTSLLRGRRWTDGMSQALAQGNLLSFSTAFRGMIEASADTFVALRYVPRLLAEHHSLIRSALLMELPAGTVVRSTQLEKLLEHYTFAKYERKPSAEDRTRVAKKTWDYMKELQEDELDAIRECYRELSDIAHPASASVFAFLEQRDEGATYTLREDSDIELIQQLSSRHQRVLLPLLQALVIPSLLTFRLISLVGLAEYSVPYVDKMDFGGIAEWKRITELLSK